MSKNAVNKGETVRYVNAGSAIAAGAVVKLKHALGIALVDIAASTGVGTVQVKGEVTAPKASGAVFVVGEKLLWDVSAGNFDDSAATPATGDVMGAAIAAVAGANGETTCTVILTPGNATET